MNVVYSKQNYRMIFFAIVYFAIVSIVVEKGSLPLSSANKQANTLLMQHCVLTPFSSAFRTTSIIPFTRFLEDNEGRLSDEEMTSIYRDLSKALDFMQSQSTSEYSVTGERIAVQLVRMNILLKSVGPIHLTWYWILFSTVCE